MKEDLDLDLADMENGDVYKELCKTAELLGKLSARHLILIRTLGERGFFRDIKAAEVVLDKLERGSRL
jgi:hypothetical protein